MPYLSYDCNSAQKRAGHNGPASQKFPCIVNCKDALKGLSVWIIIVLPDGDVQ